MSGHEWTTLSGDDQVKEQVCKRCERPATEADMPCVDGMMGGPGWTAQEAAQAIALLGNMSVRDALAGLKIYLERLMKQ